MSTDLDLTGSEVRLPGEQIILRDLRVEDITQDYVDWMNDPTVVQFTESRFQPHTVDSIGSFVEKCRKSPCAILFGIFSKADELHLGNIKLGPINSYHSIADIGLIIGRKSYWGRGVAKEGIILLKNYAFETLNLHKITASCYAPNSGSEKAFLNAGFEVEGTRRLHSKYEGEWVDMTELGCINKKGSSLFGVGNQ